MTTTLDMIQDALEKIGVYAAGETVSAADGARCLKILNDMLDSWSNESLTCFAVLEQSFPLVAGKGSYTIGTVGSPDINAPRPIRLIEGPGAAYLLDSNNNRYPVDVVPRDTWNRIWNIVSVSSNLPDTIFYDSQFPLGTINVYPLYNGALSCSLNFGSYLTLSDFAGLTTAVSLPPGYVKAIQDNLAVEAWPYFKPDNVQPPQWLLMTAAKSKGVVQRSNHQPTTALFDRALLARGAAAYNIYSDTSR